MTTAWQGWAGFTLVHFMPHCNIAGLSAWHRIGMAGIGIVAELCLIGDRTGRAQVGSASRRRGLVLR
jgi:hypothetical protein